MHDVLIADEVAGAAYEHLKVGIFILLRALHRQLMELTLHHVQEESQYLSEEDEDLKQPKVHENRLRFMVELSLVQV